MNARKVRRVNLNDEFEVPLGVPEAWAVLTDIEKVTPYLPGIWLLEVEGDEYLGVVKAKVGPVTVWYEGSARYLLLDAESHMAVIKAEGYEVGGQGGGSALVTATLSPSPRGTKVQVVTVLSLEGRIAQFAGELLAATSRSRIAEFAKNLEFVGMDLSKAAYASSTEPEGEEASFLKRLTPYLAVAGILMVAQVAVYSLRLSRRAMLDLFRVLEPRPGPRVGVSR